MTLRVFLLRSALPISVFVPQRRLGAYNQANQYLRREHRELDHPFQQWRTSSAASRVDVAGSGAETGALRKEQPVQGSGAYRLCTFTPGNAQCRHLRYTQHGSLTESQSTSITSDERETNLRFLLPWTLFLLPLGRPIAAAGQSAIAANQALTISAYGNQTQGLKP